jgi:hypothetical protein
MELLRHQVNGAIERNPSLLTSYLVYKLLKNNSAHPSYPNMFVKQCSEGLVAKGVMQGAEEEHWAMLQRFVFAETPKLPLQQELMESQ